MRCSRALTYDPVRSEASNLRVADAVEHAVARFRGVIAGALKAGVPVGPCGLLDFETGLHHEVAKECLDPVVGAVIQASLHSEWVATRSAAIVEAFPALKSQKVEQDVAVTLLGGTQARVVTPYFLQRPEPGGARRKRGQRGKPAGNGVYPCLAALGIHNGVSPALGAEVSRLAAECTLEQASTNLATRGIQLDAKQISTIGLHLARRGLKFREYLQERTREGRWRGCRGTRYTGP